MWAATAHQLCEAKSKRETAKQMWKQQSRCWESRRVVCDCAKKVTPKSVSFTTKMKFSKMLNIQSSTLTIQNWNKECRKKMSSKKLPYCSATVHFTRKGCEELTDVNANFSLQKAWNEKKTEKYERNRSETDAKHNNSQLCCLFSFFCKISVFFCFFVWQRICWSFAYLVVRVAKWVAQYLHCVCVYACAGSQIYQHSFKFILLLLVACNTHFSDMHSTYTYSFFTHIFLQALLRFTVSCVSWLWSQTCCNLFDDSGNIKII